MEGGLLFFFIFIVWWLFARLIIELIVYYFGCCCPAPLRVFFPPFLESATYPALTNVLSSGLPLPAPGLSGSLFVSGLRGLGSGCPAEWRLGEVVIWLSLQPLPRIGRFLRLGRCGLLQSAVILHGSDHGIPILHGKNNNNNNDNNLVYSRVIVCGKGLRSRWMWRRVKVCQCSACVFKKSLQVRHVLF